MGDRRRLALGDATVVAGVVIAGDLSHGTNPLATPLSAAETLVPFLFGWLTAAALLGVYREPGRLAAGPWRDARLVSGAWLAGANLALLLRASPLLSGGTVWPFPLVITGSVLGGLLLYRGTVAVAGRVRSPGPADSAGD